MRAHLLACLVIAPMLVASCEGMEPEEVREAQTKKVPSQETVRPELTPSRATEPAEKPAMTAKPIEWGEEGAKSRFPRPYHLSKAWVEYERGVHLHVAYERTGAVDDSRVRLKICDLGVRVFFVRGIRKVDDFPALKPNTAALSEGRNVSDMLWHYLGGELQDPGTKSGEGASALMWSGNESTKFPPDRGEVSVPLVGSEGIPFRGEGMAVLYLGDFFLVKDAVGGEYRQLSNAMGVPIRFPAKEGSPTKE